MSRIALSAFSFLLFINPAFGHAADLPCQNKLLLADADFRHLAEDAARTLYPEDPGGPRVLGWQINKVNRRGPRSATVAMTLVVDHPDVPDAIGIYVIVADGIVTKIGNRAFVPPREWARDGRVADVVRDGDLADRVKVAAIDHLRASKKIQNPRARVDSSTYLFNEGAPLILVHVNFADEAGRPDARDVYVDLGRDTLLTHDVNDVFPALAKVKLNTDNAIIQDFFRNFASHFMVNQRPGSITPIAGHPTFHATGYGLAARVRVFYPDPSVPRADWASTLVEVRHHGVRIEAGLIEE